MNFANSMDCIDDDQKRGLGLIASEWSLLEAHISVAIWDYLGASRENGLCVTADLGSLAKIKMLKALALNRFKSDQIAAEKISSITSLMETYNSKRNDILHNFWTPDTIPGSLRSIKFSARDGKLKEKPLTMSGLHLMETYQMISGIIHDLESFQQGHGVTPPSPTRQQQP